MSVLPKRLGKHSAVQPRIRKLPRSASIFRGLVLILVCLILTFLVLMLFTGQYFVGGMVLGSILLTGLCASNYSR